MITRKIIVVFFSLAIVVNSCVQQPINPTPPNNPSTSNYFNFSFGNISYTGTSWPLTPFDSQNTYDLSGNGFEGIVEDASNNLLMYYIVLNGNLTKATGFTFNAFNGVTAEYCTAPDPVITNSQGTDLNFVITRNDSVVGGLIEGTLNVQVKRKHYSPSSGIYCSGSLINVSGSFKIKIK